MGYNTYVTGRFTVKPRLSEKAVERLNLGEDGSCDLIAQHGGTEDTVGLDASGNIAVIPGNSWTELTPRYDEPYKAYDIGEQVENVFKALVKDGHSIEGAIYLDGEESDDFSRIRTEHNKPVFERPEFVWPNGDKGWG